MTRIISNVIKGAVGLVYSPKKPVVLDKETFLKELKSISNMRDIGNQSVSRMDLVDKYKEGEVLNWLSEIALNKEEKDIKYRQQAIQCLRWLNKPETIETLIKCLEDDNADIRCAAVRIISGIDDSRVVPLLLKCSNDADKNVRFWSIDHLALKGIRRARV